LKSSHTKVRKFRTKALWQDKRNLKIFEIISGWLKWAAAPLVLRSSWVLVLDVGEHHTQSISSDRKLSKLDMGAGRAATSEGSSRTFVYKHTDPVDRHWLNTWTVPLNLFLRTDKLRYCPYLARLIKNVLCMLPETGIQFHAKHNNDATLANVTYSHRRR